MGTKLKAQLIAAIDKEFLTAIEDPELGFGREQTDVAAPGRRKCASVKPRMKCCHWK